MINPCIAYFHLHKNRPDDGHWFKRSSPIGRVVLDAREREPERRALHRKF